jgi:S-adenosylhomocysteine hydrolase
MGMHFHLHDVSDVFQWSLPDGSANYKSVKPLPLKSVGIIGLGTMGSGIAMATLNAGIPVILIEYDKQVNALKFCMIFR